MCGTSADGSGAITGGGAAATGFGSLACGPGSNAGSNSTSVGGGAGATANGESSSAYGRGALAGGLNAVAIGAFSRATAEDASAIGPNARAELANSTAIGAGATTTRANQVAVGTGSSTYTLAGLPSAASNAAQSGPTRLVTTDGAGNLGTSSFDPNSIATLNGRVDGLQTGLNNLGREVLSVKREARQGIAAAMAMASAPMPSAPGRTTWATNAAAFRGEWAGGFSVAHRLDTARPLAITGGYAYGGGDSHGGRLRARPGRRPVEARRIASR